VLSLLEQFHARHGDREVSGLSVTWRDVQAQGCRTIWCVNTNPGGCVVMSKLGHWEGGQFVLGNEFERDGRKLVFQEVFSDFTQASFTQTIYEGEPVAEESRA